MSDPIFIYLDSSDYSAMSEPRGIRPELMKVRDACREFAVDPRIRFVYSAVHISEMAPLDTLYADAAAARADLLVELCARNALIPFTQLYDLELERLVLCEEKPIVIVSPDGDWFDMPDTDFETLRIDWQKTASGALADMFEGRPPSRKMRRIVASATRKAQSNTRQGRGIPLEDWPFRPREAKVFMAFAAGGSSKEDIEEAFREALRDPAHMMRWFRSEKGSRSSLSNLLRKPANEMMTNMRQYAARFADLRQASADEVDTFLHSFNWSEKADEMLLKVCSSILGRKNAAGSVPAIDDVVRFCPGISAQIRTLFGVLRTVMEGGKRTPTDSAFVDSAHALYAPYVSVFRADKSMAPNIARATNESDVRIARLLTEVPAIVNDLLA